MTTTPTPTQPYPDESTWWAQFEDEVAGLYADASQTINWAAFRWSARTAYDIGVGMDPEASKQKHLAELRLALGLPPEPTPPEPPVGIIRPLHVDGPIFRDDQNLPWRWKMVTAFKAAQRWADGEDLSDFVRWTRSVGANGWRVFLQHAFLDSHGPDWDPVPWILPVSRVRAFVDWMATQGLYVELVVLVDCQSAALNMQYGAQVARLTRVLVEVEGAPNVFVEWANEPADNGVDIPRLLVEFDGHFPNILMALGTYPKTGSEPNFAHRSYIGDHPPREPSWTTEAGKIGHYVYEQTSVPWIADEWVKFAEPGADPEATEQDPATAPLRAEEAAATGLSGAGMTFHCRSGINTTVPGPRVETPSARALFSAMDRFPADAVCGDYTHDGVPGNPTVPMNDPAVVGEVAGRVVGSMAYLVGAFPTIAWTPVPADGWRFVYRDGLQQNLLTLEHDR